MTTLASPVALVTGSTSGIGRAIARSLSLHGMTVVVHSRTHHDEGLRLAHELKGTYEQADLADEAQCSSLVDAVIDTHGRLDVLVNNAGISWPIPHEDLGAANKAVWQQVLDVNLIAPWLVTTRALPFLRASGRPGGGVVVNIASHAGVRPRGAAIPYAASKAALNHTTRLLASALGPEVRVNAVAPGLVDTPLSANWSEAQQLWREHAPMRRAARPEDVANIVWSLIENTYITGEIIVLDGGLNLR